MDSRQTLPSLVIKGKTIKIPIIQGGMGVGVSLSPLASAVAEEGGVGIVSSAALDRLVSKRTGKKHTTYEAVYEEISQAKAKGGVSGINIMVALIKTYEDSVKGAIDAGADVIISGAGLPLSLPVIQKPGDTALIPIVSSARALELMCKKWERLGYRPDAVVLEGPLAGGIIKTLPGYIENHPSTKTIANCSYFCLVNRWLQFQEVHGRKESRLGNIKILHKLRGEPSCIVRVHCRLAITVHIYSKGCVTQLGQHLRPLSRIIIESPPFMHHQNARPLAFQVFIICQIPFENHTLACIIHRLPYNLRGPIRHPGHPQHQHENHHSYCISLHYTLL